MKRIWNGLRYGDFETRKCIGSVLALVIAAVGFVIAAIASGKFYLFIIALICGVIALLISQTFTLVDDDFVAEVGRDGEKDTVNTVSVKKNGMSSKTTEQKDIISYERYSAQEIKRIKKKHHVKKDHRPIIIDSSKTFKIKECPAFIWRVHNKVYLLLIEKEPRKIILSRERIKHMDYVPGVRADKVTEYPAFKEDNLVTSVFEGYLPDYYDDRTGKMKYKNLYKIHPDILITNRSAAQVMDLLYLNFMPEDKITSSEKLNGYFKRIYAANILMKDKVYSLTEYKEEVDKVLKELCYAEMPEREFNVTLENLVKGRMISQQYADHFAELKKKQSK